MRCHSKIRIREIYHNNMSFTTIEAKDGNGSIVDTLKCLNFMSWKRRYILQHQREVDAESGRAKTNLTEASIDKGQLTTNTVPETASGTAFKSNKIGKMAKSLIRNRQERTKNSMLFQNNRGSRRARKGRMRKKSSSVTDGSNETAVGENEDVPARNQGIVESEVTLNDDEQVQQIIIEELCQNPGDPEWISMPTSTELFQKYGYPVTDYSGDSEGFKTREEQEGSDKSASIGQLSPGECALLNGTFELISGVNQLEVEKKESSSWDQSYETAGKDNSTDSNGSNSSTNGSIAKHLTEFRNENGLYVCVFCSKAFRCKYALRYHMKTHTGDAPTCSVCNKIFTRKYNLIIHMRTHTGEKPYDCEACGKRFADKSNLNAHIRTHTGERPYRCELCNKGFISSSGLVVHRILHTGERPFTCGSCDELFCTKGQLQYHLKKIHLRRTFYRCQHCFKYYLSVYSLRCHLKKSHVSLALIGSTRGTYLSL